MALKVKYKYKHSAIGGTFDTFHKGHASLLHSGFQISERVTIGLSSDEFVKTRLKNNYEDYNSRLRQLEDFLRTNDYLTRAFIIRLDDIFGTTLIDQTLDSIIVTNETIEGARRINEERRKKGLGELEIHVVPLVLGQRKRVISSSGIKQGLINRAGYDYFANLGANKYILPDEIRVQVSKPQGRIIAEDDLKRLNFDNYSKVITVGDIVTKTFIKQGLRFHLAIVDLNSNRRKLFNSLDDLGIYSPDSLAVVKNIRGTISKSLSGAIRDVVVKNINGAVIKVIGEEDLAVIPAVILAPLGSAIFYGQRDQGIVYIDVDEKTKEKFLKILGGFRKL